MLSTPWTQDQFSMPDRNIYRISKFHVPRTSHKQRNTRALSDRNSHDRQTELQEELKILINKKSKEAITDIHEKLRKTHSEMRLLERFRAVSHMKETGFNEKVKLSIIKPDLQKSVSTKRIIIDRFQTTPRQRPIQVKRTPVELPPQKKIQVKHCFRLKVSRQTSTEDLMEPQTDRPIVSIQNSDFKMKPLKITTPLKHQNMDDMINLFEEKRMQDLVSDVSLKKYKVNYAKIRAELKSVLRLAARLNLSLEELFHKKMLSSKPFWNPYGKEFIQAAKLGRIEDVKELLIENRYLVFDFDYIYMSALHWACKRGHFDIVRLLLKNGADVEFTDIIGRPALYFAIIGCNLLIVKTILDHKADPWSNSSVNYNEVCEQYYPPAYDYIAKARKQHIMLKMTPPLQRARIWKYMRN